MNKRYFQNFIDIDSLHKEFHIDSSIIKDEEVLIGWYGYGSYCGSANVLFQRDGKLYEVSGSHCSCYGLEGQWAPAETSWEALAMRTESWGPVNNTYEDDNGKQAETAYRELVRQHVPRA